MAGPVIPPPPEGFTLDAGTVPPPPEGFVLDGQTPPRAGVLETAGLVGGQLLDTLTHHIPGAVAATYEGSQPGTGFANTLVERSRQRGQEATEAAGKGPTMLPGIGREDIAQLGPSMGFSVPPMVGGLVAGVPSAAVGTAVGGPVGGAVGGYGAGMATAGGIAYRQSENQFVRDLRDAANVERKKSGLGPISDEEFNAKRGQLDPLIREYGLWEAVPEAAASGLGFGILKAPVKAGIGAIFGHGTATRLASKAGALLGEELATETVTQHGQHNTEQQAKGVLGVPQEAPRSWTSPSDIATSFGEIAPVTTLQTGLMAGGARLAGIRPKSGDTGAPTPEAVSETADALRAPAGAPPNVPPPPPGFTIDRTMNNGEAPYSGFTVDAMMRQAGPEPVMTPQEVAAVPPGLATPTSLPPGTQQAPGEMNSGVVQVLAQKAKELGARAMVAADNVGMTDPDTAWIPASIAARVPQMAGALAEHGSQLLGNVFDTTTKANPGANISRLAALMGPNLYGSPDRIADVTVKEMLQNSFDALKGLIASGKTPQGKIHFNLDPIKRTLAVTDNGSGMSPDVLGGAFLRIADTHKETTQASGGFGIAKMLYLFGNDRLSVTTMRNGVVYRMNTSGPELLASSSEPQNDSLKPTITHSAPTAQDALLFPEGHGTHIEVQIPKTYRDPSTGEMKEIRMATYGPNPYDALIKSPLFHNIDVQFNGESVPNIGASFDHSKYTQFVNVKFDWGTAHVYVSKDEVSHGTYEDNVHVLSNGLWQFDTTIKKDMTSPYSDPVSREFFIDVSPTVKPEEAGYPFDLNRQGFAKPVAKDFDKIFTYMSLLYQQEAFQEESLNYGRLQYLSRDESGVHASEKLQIKPKMPPKATAANLIRSGDQVSVEDGKLIVNGREIPALTVKDLEALKGVDFTSLKVDQSEIDPNVVMLHDNIDVAVSALETRSLVDLARERYGDQFDAYAHDMGEHFKELRDVIAKMVPGYKGLLVEGIGISFDQEYHGVSIRIPFAASFLNIAIPHESETPFTAAVSMVWTMMHELAHHKIRSENGLAPYIQQLATYLDLHPTFDFRAFKQKVINTVAANEAVFRYLHGVMTSGTFPIRSRGKRLATTSSYQARDGGGVADNGVAGSARGGPNTSAGASPSPRAASSIFGRPGVSLKISSTGNDTTNGRAANQRALDLDASGIPAAERQPEVDAALGNLNRLFDAVQGGPPKPVKTFAAHADRMNRFFKYAFSLPQLARSNMRFTPLLQYNEGTILMHNTEAEVHDAAIRVGKRWRSLGARGEGLVGIFDDLANMRYLTPQEVAVNTVRMPTNAELQALLTKYKIDGETLKVFNDVRGVFQAFLTRVEQLAVAAAQRIVVSDPVKLANMIDQIRAQIKEMRAKPYFPFMRYGRHFVMVKNAAGRIVKFETFERRGVRSAESYQTAAYNAAMAGKATDEVVTAGVLPENASPFVGMPPALLNMIETELQLTPDQVTALEQIQLQQSPALSFKRLMKSNFTPGYSMDFLRSFARYFFHGGRYLARTEYGHVLRGYIAAARAAMASQPTVAMANKAGLIADYMQDHLDNTVLDAKGDYGVFKAGIFLWAMGYVPSAAAQNLSQTPMITYPFLSGKFGGAGIGNVRATKALAKAIGDVKNFYKKENYNKTSTFERAALLYGIETGRLSETQAAELAGLSTQGNLFQGIAGHALQRASVNFMEKAAWMFEMAEKFNRRVAYMSALDLAMKYPNAKAVQEALKIHSNEYHELQTRAAPGGGTFTPQQAAAIVTAAYVTDTTQIVYAKYARPRMFRGKLPGTLFVFKMYMQGVLGMLGQNKRDVLPQYLLMAALLGGMGGIPGYDDFRDILRAVALWLFGKDFNLDRKTREWVTQHTDGTIPPDIILHGLARAGYGLPALVDMMGSAPGRGLHSTMPGQNVPFPTFDRSRALSMGNILPIEIGKLMQPSKDVNQTIADQTQKASGAVFSVGFNLYKALQSSEDPSDFKRWEKAMPRALSSASSAYRAYSEGRERGKGGPNSAPTIVPFDVRDTEQMMEVIGMAAGYRPVREQAKWDSILSKVEVEKYYDMRREALLHQMFEATSGKIPQEIESARNDIIKYNKEIAGTPAEGKAIRAETLQSSLQARQREKIHREIGVPTQRSNIGISRYIDTLFPETTVDVRRVR